MGDERNADLNAPQLDVEDILQVLSSWDFPEEDGEKEAHQEQSDGKSYVRILNDGMEAWLSLAPAVEEPYTEASVHEFVKSQGITNGILESNVKAMVRKKVYNRETLIAVALKAQEGKDGYYQFYFRRDNQKPAPHIRPDGTVDYGSFHLIETVKKDDMLAMYHPATKGKAGCNVQGKVLPFNQGKDLPPLKGKGFYRNEGSNAYFAARDGRVEYKDGEIEIRSTHIIEGDVTIATGSVEFFGDIIIHGNVESGVSIKTGRTLTIDGTLGACNIYAVGDIILKKGVQGGNKSKIVTRGNLYADFIEHSDVEATKEIKANVIMNSNVISEDKIILTGSRGAIIGGYTHADKGIEIKCAGNDAEIRTVIHVGKQSGEQQEQQEIDFFSTDAQQLFHQELNKETEAPKAYIKVDGTIYRGTIICVDENQHIISEKTSFMEYENTLGKLTSKIIIH